MSSPWAQGCLPPPSGKGQHAPPSPAQAASGECLAPFYCNETSNQEGSGMCASLRAWREASLLCEWQSSRLGQGVARSPGLPDVCGPSARTQLCPSPASTAAWAPSARLAVPSALTRSPLSSSDLGSHDGARRSGGHGAEGPGCSCGTGLLSARLTVGAQRRQ